MARRGSRSKLTEAEKHEVLWRLRQGETHREVAQVFGCSTKCIQRELRRTGGLSSRRIGRSSRQLSLDERETIGIGLATGQSLRVIARLLGRAPSTVSREVLRNGSPRTYRAWRADVRAAGCARRPKLEKLRQNLELRAAVEERLKQRGLRNRFGYALVWPYTGTPAARASATTSRMSWSVRLLRILRPSTPSAISCRARSRASLAP
jgi:IS30 family transposase